MPSLSPNKRKSSGMSHLCVKWRFRAHPPKRKGARGTARNPAWKPLLERNLCAAAPHRLTIRVTPQSERFSARSEARKMLEAPQAPRQQGAAPRVSPCGQRACRPTGLGSVRRNRASPCGAATVRREDGTRRKVSCPHGACAEAPMPRTDIRPRMAWNAGVCVTRVPRVERVFMVSGLRLTPA